MSVAPVARLKKSEIIWLGSHRCKHSHTYLEHFSCYLAECPDRGKIGFFDIETSVGFKANMGIMISYAIKDDDFDDKVVGRVISRKELKSWDMDKQLVIDCQRDLMSFDIVVGYYSTKFDLPFVRSRAVHHGLEFPAYGEIVHSDLYYIVRNKFALTSNRLETACRFLLGDTEKTHIDYRHWIRAIQGDPESLEYVWDHNVKDVNDTARLYHKIIPYKKRMDTSV